LIFKIIQITNQINNINYNFEHEFTETDEPNDSSKRLAATGDDSISK
jgi:hypothetical protein